MSGDQAGHLRIWDLQANACSQELTPADYDFLDPTPGTGESTGSMGGSIDDELAAGQASGQASSRPLPRHAGDAGARAVSQEAVACLHAACAESQACLHGGLFLFFSFCRPPRRPL